MESAFVVLIGVLLFARAGLRRPVPMAAFYVASAAWAIELIWSTISGSLDWILGALGIVERYSAPPSALSLFNLAVSTLVGLALIVAVLIAARGAQVEPVPEAPKA
jgi:hypothetical protein